MNEVTGKSSRIVDAIDLQTRLRAVGILYSQCDSAGHIINKSPEIDDWLFQLLLRSRFMYKTIESASSKWHQQEEPACEELFEGCWCLPVPIISRRKRTGYHVILVPTGTMLQTEQFRAMCQSALLDYEICQTRYSAIEQVSSNEVHRLTQLAKYLLVDYYGSIDAHQTMDSLSQQLAESYEEISLLYTIGQSMNVIQQPARFVGSACKGLFDTLQYRWIGAQFADGINNLKSLSGKLMIAGEHSSPVDELRNLARDILNMARSEGPMVLDTAGKPEYAHFSALGCPVLIHPICREDHVLGVIIAADKQGQDREATGTDMKLLEATASHTSVFLENASLYQDMDAMFLGTLEAISASIDAKDRYTCGHSKRVAILTQQLAASLEMDDETIRLVHIAGLVHDVGKIGVPESVLSKPGRLTDDEFEAIKQHPEIGYRILKDIPRLNDVLPGVLYHHEKWDGTGYPEGLSKQHIPLFARLIALADTFDAMSSTRTYRSARERSRVLQEIQNMSGTQFDPDLVPVFIKMDFTEFDKMIAKDRTIYPEMNDFGGQAA